MGRTTSPKEWVIEPLNPISNMLGLANVDKEFLISLK